MSSFIWVVIFQVELLLLMSEKNESPQIAQLNYYRIAVLK